MYDPRKDDKLEEEFLSAWQQLERDGFVDGAGGHQYQRMYYEFVNANKPGQAWEWLNAAMDKEHQAPTRTTQTGKRVHVKFVSCQGCKNLSFSLYEIDVHGTDNTLTRSHLLCCNECKLFQNLEVSDE